jgi:hypothetical protein
VARSQLLWLNTARSEPYPYCENACNDLSSFTFSRFKVSSCSCLKAYDRSLAGIAGSNPAGGMSVSCECCVLSGRGLGMWPITRSEQPYRLWFFIACDLQTSVLRRP